jgi:hypothetical protein
VTQSDAPRGPFDGHDYTRRQSLERIRFRHDWRIKISGHHQTMDDIRER